MIRYFSVVVTLCMAIFLVSCGTHNPMQPQLIESGPLQFSEDKIPLDSGQYIYKQTIGLSDPAADCVYAYKIETYSSELPENLYTDAEGWLYFHSPGSDTSLPLSEPGNHRTIWTAQSYLSAQFASTEGKITNLITSIHIRIKAPDGSISEINSPFKSNRIVSSRIVSPSVNGIECGTGLEFVMQEEIGDIFVDGLYAHHFMYRLNILNAQLQVVQNGYWMSSIWSPEIRKVILNSDSAPAITANEPNQFTQFECYVVGRSGIEEATHQTVYFRAVTGNKPIALIYPQTIAGLGQYHYSITDEDPMTIYELIPSPNSHKNRRLFSVNNVVEAIHTADFKLHLRWGYFGQYGVIVNNNPIYTNNPWSNEIGTVLNPSGTNYYSKIIAYDLRWDGNPFPVKPYFIEPVLVSHPDGSTWLRVQNINDAARHNTFSNLSSGTHQLQVCAVDLQGAISDPASVAINLVPFKPNSQRSGIMVVDDSPHHNTYSPEATVDNFYTAVVPTAWGAVSAFETDAGDGNVNYPSPTQLQNYKAVLWHSDNPSANGTLGQNADALELFLAGGGNLLLSGTSKLVNAFSQLSYCQDFLSNHFGLSSLDQVNALSQSLTTNPYFVSAIGQNGLSNIALNLDNPFNSIVNLRQGLSMVTYFNAGANLDFLYKFGCKSVNAATYPPTQEQYDLYSQKYVAYKHSQEGATVVVFGFPLSYMDQADVDTALQSVFADLIGGSYAKGGRP